MYTTNDGQVIFNDNVAEAVPPCEEPLSPQQKFNYGIIGCGYVGMTLARHWQSQGHFVTATTTRQERVAELEAAGLQGVIMKGSDAEAVRCVVENQDAVVLSIAPISDRQVDAQMYRETYIPTAKNLAEALKESFRVKQVIYLSSCSVYGKQQGEWVDETSTCATSSEYGQVLSETEQILLDLAREDLKVCILRLGGIYGPERELTKRFAKIAGKNFSGNGDTFTSWIYLDDIIGGIDFLAQRRLGGIYNLVNDFNLTIRELGDKICDQEGLEKILWENTKSSYRFLNARVSNQKIKTLGYKLIHPKTII